jgi:23S rRNA pseudouridine2605 synthase
MKSGARRSFRTSRGSSTERRRAADRRLVSLERALSKLGALSRGDARKAIQAGRVSVEGRPVRDPARRVEPERARIVVDGVIAARGPWRTIAFHKPRGVITSRRDRQGRPTVFTLLGDTAGGLVAAGRLDFASSGLLLLTNDTRLADWITDPAHGVTRAYAVTVRGRLPDDAGARLVAGVVSEGERLAAHAVDVRKTSGRESHLTIELREGKNREVRRLLAAIGHEVVRLKRVRFGGLCLAGLAPGEWREVTRAEIRSAFPGACMISG